MYIFTNISLYIYIYLLLQMAPHVTTTSATTTSATPPGVRGDHHHHHHHHHHDEHHLESLYDRQLHPSRVRGVSDLRTSHFFRSSYYTLTGEMRRTWNNRLISEIADMSSSLPVSCHASIFLVYDEAAMMFLRACLLPSADTPYAHGAFLFDIFVPSGYPTVPPKVKFLTTGSGTVRFNPNLYDNGKVCLSLLGTWDGPSWEPQVSSIWQVLVSIQSMIFCEEPYLNEPGHTAGVHSQDVMKVR